MERNERITSHAEMQGAAREYKWENKIQRDVAGKEGKSWWWPNREDKGKGGKKGDVERGEGASLNPAIRTNQAPELRKAEAPQLPFPSFEGVAQHPLSRGDARLDSNSGLIPHK